MRGFWHSVALSEVLWPVCGDSSLVRLPIGLVFIYFHNGLASNSVQASGRHICVQAAGAPIFPHVFTGAALHRHTGVQGFALDLVCVVQCWRQGWTDKEDKADISNFNRAVCVVEVRLHLFP